LKLKETSFNLREEVDENDEMKKIQFYSKNLSINHLQSSPSSRLYSLAYWKD
jgi:hypothetical protein